jgi:hypothetical protein
MFRTSPRLVVRAHVTRVLTLALAFALTLALFTPSAAALQVSLVGQAMKIDPPDTSAPFDMLDTVQGANVDLLLWSIDGMTFDPSGERLYVVNPYGGRVLRFSVSGEPHTPPAGNSLGASGALGVLGSRGGFSAGGHPHRAPEQPRLRVLLGR